jgi:hypothetical protein
MKRKIILLVVAIAMLAAITSPTLAENAAAIVAQAENTATSWTLEAAEDTVIVIDTTLTGTNLVFYLSLIKDGKLISYNTIPGNLVGQGTFDIYFNIGGYTVYVPIQGNEMGKHGNNPRIVDYPGDDGHAWKKTDEKAATCTENGYVVWKCTKHSSEGIVDVIDALGHDEKEEYKAPTCTEPGYIKVVCKRDGCGAILREETDRKSVV